MAERKRPVAMNDLIGMIDFICIILLIYIAVTDMRKMIISNKVLAVLLVMSVIKQFLSAADISSLLISTGIVIIIFTVLYYSVENLIGGGDVKLIFVLSIWLGYPQVVVALYLAFIAGGIFAAFYLLFEHGKTVDKIAFAPFLVIGSLISLFENEAVLNFWQMMTV